MTKREPSFRRLAHLRELQHDIAALHLRTARGSLVIAEAALTAAQEHARAARLSQIAAATGDLEAWLLARADVAVGTLAVAANHAVVAQAMAALQLALQAEAAARRDRKQMEVIVEAVRSARSEQTGRAEQRSLDEISQSNRAHLAHRRALEQSVTRAGQHDRLNPAHE